MAQPAHSIHVELGNDSYDIQIGSGILGQIGRLIAGMDVTHCVLVTDEHVMEPHAKAVAEALVEWDIEPAVLVIPAGETSKSIDMASTLWDEMLKVGTDRRTMVVAVGGGVVGDLAGFLAATFARGIRFFQVPTSLLAQVDSSVGGKVGINLEKAKNMVGAFLQPQGVLIDVGTLDTLPVREYISGLGEVVKYGMILDAPFFDFLEEHAADLLNRDHELLNRVVARCCRLKADVVEEDERETSGRRAILNYGHTFAHALESLSGYGRLLHGEAVAIGMVCAARLAVELGMIDADSADRQQTLLERLRLPVELPANSASPREIYDAMRHDKKVQHGRLRLILPTRIGEVTAVEEVDSKQILKVLKR